MPQFTRLLALPAAVGALLLTGCATMSPPPPVDILPTTAPPLAAAPRTPPPVTGGLFHQASYRPAFEDRRARMVGDNVTVMIVENVTASQKSSSTVDRTSEASAGITNLPFVKNSLADKTKLGAGSESTFSGKGGTESVARGLYPALAKHDDIELVGIGNLRLAADPPRWFPGEVVGLPVDGENRPAWAAAVAFAVAPRARLLGANVLHCPSNFGPAVRLLPTVVTVHDVLPMRHPEWVPDGRAWGVRALIRATVRAASRRGWVCPMAPRIPRPSSRQIFGSCVVLPEPVSPATITTW